MTESPTGPLVSIILPAYNRSRYIGSAIESVLDQTYPRWELIVVDDGSTDRTLEIVERYAAKYPDRIQVITQRNMGVAVARNTGIRRSTGTYVAFIDSDDLWQPAKLERQLEVCARTPNAAFAYTGYDIIEASGQSRRTVRPDPRFRGDVSTLLWTEDNEILGPTLMVSREKLFAVGLFNERLRGAENLDLRLKLAKLGPVVFVDATLYSYRKHDASLTADGDAMREYTRRMLHSHFDEPPANENRRLRRYAFSTFTYREGNVYFERMQYGKAFGCYLRAWAGSRRKLELLQRLVRCGIGRRGNALLRALKTTLHKTVEGVACL